MGPPIFGRSVNPIPIGEGRLSPPITTGTPNVFHLPASLQWYLSRFSFVGTVELGDSELLDSEQTGNSEDFPMTNLPLYFINV